MALLTKRVVETDNIGKEYVSEMIQQEDREQRLVAAVEFGKLAVHLKELEETKDLRVQQLQMAAMAQGVGGTAVPTN